MESWRSFWSKNGGDFKNADVTAVVTAVMAPKEDTELAVIKKAAGVTSEVFSKYLKEQIMDIIDSDKVKTVLMQYTLKNMLKNVALIDFYRK